MKKLVSILMACLFVLALGGCSGDSSTSKSKIEVLKSSITQEELNIIKNKTNVEVFNDIKKRHNVMIGERTAEDLKINIGCVFPKIQDVEMDVRGRHLGTGLPVTLSIHSSEMMEAVLEPAMQIVDAVHGVLEKTPP